METLERVLAQHPFFEGLDPQYTSLLVGCASNVRFEPGAYVFREGEEANHFYLVREGRITIEVRAPQRQPLIVETLGEGDILGWSWLIPPYQWRFDARASLRTRALALDGKCLRNKCEENHDLGFVILKRFAHIVDRRLEAMRFQLLDVYAAG